MLLVIMSVLSWAGASDFSASSAANRIVLPCEEARLKCAFRVGCGMALQNYVVHCSSVLQGPSNTCPEICQHALIALTSTEEGKDLMQCSCNDDFCTESKRRVEICRPSVTRANRNESIVSCTVAQWICAADPLCFTALDFYNLHCKSMFHGRKCTHRCQNSISILRRQEKAAKLKTCTCDGNENYNCTRIQANMARLCFHKKAEVPSVDLDTNVIADSGDSKSASIRKDCRIFPLITALVVLLCATL